MPRKPLLNANTVSWEAWSYGERYGGRTKPLGINAGAIRVGVNLEELPPGKKSCPAHYHTGEEEHLYVLSGTPTLVLGGEDLALEPGSYVCFPAGEAVAHHLENRSSHTCTYLMIGERNPLDTCVYPTSNKLMVRALREVYRRHPVDYWEGE